MKIHIHKDAFKPLFKKPRYVSWYREASHHQRKDDCTRLKTTIARQCIPLLRWYDDAVIGTPRAEIYTWVDPRFLSRRHNDIQYVLCLKTLQQAFDDDCSNLAFKTVDSLLTEKEKETEYASPEFVKKNDGFYEMKERVHPAYEKFDGRTFLKQVEHLKSEYMKNPPESIAVRTGFSVTHVCSYALFAEGIVEAPFLTIPVVNQAIEDFLSLEHEFLPVLQEAPLPSMSRYMREKFAEMKYPYENYRNVSRNSLVLDPDWFAILVDRHASPEAKAALEAEKKEWEARLTS